MIISIFASIWSQNLWDELILKNEIKLLRQEYNDNKIKFIVFSYDYKNPFFIDKYIEYKEYFPIETKKIKNIYRNIFNFLSFLLVVLKSDLIVIWWWWLFFDEEIQTTANPLKIWFYRANIFRFFNKKIRFFALWLNISKEENKQIIKQIFTKAYKISVRDNFSKNLLKELNIDTELVMDPVFYDNISSFNIKKNLCIKKIKSRWFTKKDLNDIDFFWKTLAIALRKWYISNNFNEQEEFIIIKDLLEFLKGKWAKIILLVHSFHKTEISANDYIWMNKFKNSIFWIKITNSLEETYNYYKEKKIDIILAQRLHSIILAHTYDIQYIALSYSKKTDEVLDIIAGDS